MSDENESCTPIVPERYICQFGCAAARETVYAAIDTERAYQNRLERNTVQKQRPMEQLALIRRICRDMEDHWYDQPGQPPMDYMRKIAAVAVRAMEEHGAPERN